MFLTTKHSKYTEGIYSSKDGIRSSRSARRAGGKARGGVGSLNKLFCIVFACFIFFAVAVSSADFLILNRSSFSHYVDRFNSMEDENYTNTISNAESWSWVQKEIPFFECPDSEIEELYYFRWWSFRKHLVHTPSGWVITEFLMPIKHAGAFNTISCAAGFHVAEGRWLHDPEYVDDYISFWFHGNNGRPQPHFHKYSSWIESAAYDNYLVTGDKNFLTGLLNDFVADYTAWENEKLTTNGLFWQFDVRDGMEESISGSRTNKNLRPTINSYMFANARAIAKVARLAGNKKIAKVYEAKASDLKQRVEQLLWNPNDKFFEVRRDNGNFSDVREELGFIPWMFELPSDDARCSVAWSQLNDSRGFAAPYGITTTERRTPQFRSHGFGHCEWDGAVWPFATCQTLDALANVLRDYPSSVAVAADVNRRNYFDAFLTYVHSQHADGKPYIGEYLDETTGQWINGANGRSRYYNHSTFADLMITGVVGLVPRADNTVEVYPLLPDGTWNWFCLDGIKYHGRMLTILWDQDGTRYGRGKGLIVFADGKQIAHADKLSKLTGKLP